MDKLIRDAWHLCCNAPTSAYKTARYLGLSSMPTILNDKKRFRQNISVGKCSWQRDMEIAHTHHSKLYVTNRKLLRCIFSHPHGHSGKHQNAKTKWAEIIWIPWNWSFHYIHCTGQFTPRMKANAELHLLSSLVWIDSGVVVSQHRLESFFMK